MRSHCDSKIVLGTKSCRHPRRRKTARCTQLLTSSCCLTCARLTSCRKKTKSICRQRQTLPDLRAGSCLQKGYRRCCARVQQKKSIRLAQPRLLKRTRPMQRQYRPANLSMELRAELELERRPETQPRCSCSISPELPASLYLPSAE